MMLKEVAEMSRVDMGQCMCSVNCAKKYESNVELVNSVQKIYEEPTLSEVAGMSRVDMGQCMCSVNCTKKHENNTELVNSVQKVYKKTLKKVA